MDMILAQHLPQYPLASGRTIKRDIEVILQ